LRITHQLLNQFSPKISGAQIHVNCHNMLRLINYSLQAARHKKSVYIWIHKNNFFVMPSLQNVQKIYSPHPPLTPGQNQNPLFFEKSVKYRTLHFGGNGGTSVKKSCLGVKNNVLKMPPPTPCAKCTVSPKSVFLLISRKIWGLEKNCTGRKCSSWNFLQDRLPRVSLCKNPFKWVQIEIFAFFHVFGNFFCEYLAIYVS